MTKLYNKLHNLYPVSKTLRFELKPVGKTLENIKKTDMLNQSLDLDISYKKVKKYIDEFHKHFIEIALKNVEFTKLDAYLVLFDKKEKSEKEKEDFEKLENDLRKEIVSTFNNNEIYKDLFKMKSLRNHLYDFYENDLEIIKDLKKFERSYTYFTGYNENRKNMYSSENKSSSIAFRSINENLPTFISNLKIIENIKDSNLDFFNDTIKTMENELKIENIANFFELYYYNKLVTQKGIDLYNLILAGKSEDTNIKIKGLNEYINLYNQKNDKSKRIPKLKELYKQILSDQDKLSFKYEIIENDKNLLDMIKTYYKLFINEVFDCDNNIEFLFKNINDYNFEEIYLNMGVNINNLSNLFFNDWSYIQNALYEKYDYEYDGKIKDSEKYFTKRKDYFKKMESIPLNYIIEAIKLKDDSKNFIEYIQNYFSINNYKKKIEEKYNNFNNLINNINTLDEKAIIKSKQHIYAIKDLLDLLKEVQEYLRLFVLKDKTIKKDNSFYNLLSEKYSNITEVIGIYNKTRNYLTQNPFSNEKTKLSFECPTLLDGWDLNKEKANLSIILMKENNYYLGIINTEHRKIFDNLEKPIDNTSIYKKMEYKLLPGPNKMLPKVFFANSNIDIFNPSKELLNKYEKGLHKKGENFDIDFCHELINFFKKSLNIHEDWKKFNFKFSDTKNYNDISEFYKEVEQQGYKIDFVNINEDYINELVENDKLYLFQIYNKDFSSYSKGTPNLHTLYFKELFSKENLKNTVYQLNGGAEVFYRKASIVFKKPTHVKNEDIENKNEISKMKKKYSNFSYDLYKDKRYSEDKFLFHVPIKLNFNNCGISNINALVNKEIKENYKNINIIGIDRGERNLIYISVINYKGEILHQESLNIIENGYNNEKFKTNYHQLLSKKEEENMKSRKSWQSIENIKELKEGYLSQVINKIVNLMDKYNALIVLEDLNNGFKNSRIKVEKQVYQKFEKMLIEKLNYLVFKKYKKDDEGGLLNAYQLTNKFETFKKLGKQSGVVLYIPAWNTSKIDPTTGFVNLLYIKYESIAKSKNFISQIDDIKFNSQENYFEFYVDYKKMTSKAYGLKNKWIICSNGTRILTYRNEKSEWCNKEINLTEEFTKLFALNDIDIKNLKTSILEKEKKEFFNELLNLLRLSLQMRNSVIKSNIDYMISPVKNKNNEFFDTRKNNSKLPIDADANGAYNIARKGLMFIETIKKTEDEKLNKPSFVIKNEDWLIFAQKEK